ncbi:MAG TPA: alpha/beta hydrolase [Acidimicrobiales bacterium]|nr:alpha/beta hydrolase [Acidimicrobiales bacterium]
MLRSYGDADLFGESYGDGPPRVVWLHGWARSSEDFRAVARELARRGVASVALDLPGFGASAPPRLAGGARLYAELVLPTLREIADEPLVLVGHSFGGRVSTVIASTNPELVRSLVLSSVPLLRVTPPSSSPRGYRIVRRLHARGLVSDARMEAARQKYGSLDYRRAQGVMRDVVVRSVNESYEAELSRIQVPVVFLWGENDLDVPFEVAKRSAVLLEGAHVEHVVSGVGHLVPLEAPEALVGVVEEALSL